MLSENTEGTEFNHGIINDAHTRNMPEDGPNQGLTSNIHSEDDNYYRNCGKIM